MCFPELLNFKFFAAVVKPEIISPLKPCQAAEGKTAKFEIEVDGNPKPEVTWFKGSRELSDGPKYEIFKEGDKHVLLIKDVFGQDADEYSARVTNKGGSKTSRADLTIRSKQ